ncbi:MAG TPA: hypothetical protein VGU27_02190 [Candidatus Eisenbacteria bacterium]|nr:hypothetical protein [Candidatus Eisenbacteria bacterium]
MKRLIPLFAMCMLVGAAVFAYAQQGTKTEKSEKTEKAGMTMKMAKGKMGTWKGEVLDAGCFLSDGAMGEKHKECALKCAANGMPLMLHLNGKPVLLTPNHDNADPYAQLKTLAGSVVEVTGTMYERAGVTGIDVTGVKAVDAAAPAQK